MASFAMERESWFSEEWWSMGNIPMNCTSYRLVAGNGRDLSPNPARMDHPPAQDWVRLLNYPTRLALLKKECRN